MQESLALEVPSCKPGWRLIIGIMEIYIKNHIRKRRDDSARGSREIQRGGGAFWPSASRAGLLVALIFPLLLSWSCVSLMLPRPYLIRINEVLLSYNFEARKDIPEVYPERDSKDVLYKKGDKLKIWLESGGDWVRVKAYPADKPREQARGNTIIYIFAPSADPSLKKKGAQERVGKDKKNTELDSGGKKPGKTQKKGTENKSTGQELLLRDMEMTLDESALPRDRKLLRRLCVRIVDLLDLQKEVLKK